MLPRKPLILTFFKAMFANRDVSFKSKRFPLRKVKGLRRYDVGNLLFIEQNKEKKTEWAERARRGAKILWIIDTKWDRYLVRVENGKITYLKSSSRGES